MFFLWLSQLWLPKKRRRRRRLSLRAWNWCVVLQNNFFVDLRQHWLVYLKSLVFLYFWSLSSLRDNRLYVLKFVDLGGFTFELSNRIFGQMAWVLDLIDDNLVELFKLVGCKEGDLRFKAISRTCSAFFTCITSRLQLELYFEAWRSFRTLGRFRILTAQLLGAFSFRHTNFELNFEALVDLDACFCLFHRFLVENERVFNLRTFNLTEHSLGEGWWLCNIAFARWQF